MAISPLPSRGLENGRHCYITHAFLGVPNRRERNHKYLSHPYFLGGPKVGRIATSSLCSWGSPIEGDKLTSGYNTTGFWGGLYCYRTLAFDGATL